MTSYEIGQIFESVARFYLRCSGFKILGQRIKTKHGEIDILGQKGEDLYIFEVKKRKNHEEALNSLKLRNLERSINAFFDYQAKQKLEYRELFIKGIIFTDSIFPEIIDIDILD